MTPNLVATMDTSKLSIRKGAQVFSASASALQIELPKTNINKSTLHRARVHLRKENAKKVREKFKSAVDDTEPLTLHWDGKKMKYGQHVEERLPVLVTGHIINEQLLGSPVLNQATGDAQAKFNV